VLALCDGYLPGEVPEFFFDRNWHSFNSILVRSVALLLLSLLAAVFFFWQTLFSVSSNPITKKNHFSWIFQSK
jgi:hypothetical protein